ncbi:MAG: type VI secretion system-associated FHA domain protein TagH [Casimicrobiaceae bacterium]
MSSSLTITVVRQNGAALAEPLHAEFGAEGGTIGRSAASTLLLPDPDRQISRIHGRIEPDGDRFVLRDQGTATPVIVNGRRLGNGHAVHLAAGDEIVIAGYVMRVEGEAFDPDATLVRGRTVETSLHAADISMIGTVLSWSEGGAPVPVDRIQTVIVPSPRGEGDDAPARASDVGDSLAGAPAVVVEGATAAVPTPADRSAAAPAMPATTTPTPTTLAPTEPAPTAPAPIAPAPIAPAPTAPAPIAPAPTAPAPTAPAPTAPAPTAPAPTAPAVVAPGLAAPAAAPTASPRTAPALDVPEALSPVDASATRADSGEPLPLSEGDAKLADDAALNAASAALPSQAQPAGPTADALLEALLAGVGVAQLRVPDGLTPEFMQALGEMLRESVRGLLDLLHARALTKREVRADATVIVAQDNNPLKFSPTLEAAMAHLLVPRGTGFMPPLRAVADAHDSLRSHQLAFMAGMQAGLASILQRLDPRAVESRSGEPSLLGAFVPATRKASLWDLYTTVHTSVVRDADADFQAIFGREFLRAYQHEVNERRVRESVRPPS